MVLERTRPHRSLLPLIVVVALVATSSATVVARSVVGPPATVLQAPDRAGAVASVGAAAVGPSYDRGAALRSGLVPVRPPAAPGTTEPAKTGPDRELTDRPTPAIPKPEAKSESTTTAAPDSGGGSGSGSTSRATSTKYRGRNHVWIPSLGIDRSVSGFSCSSTAYPGNRVYRWGCAGVNNVYLFGHAHSVFKPLHDAYVRGRLKKGMKVIYADSKGRVTTYAVRWWKVVRPDQGEFAYAAQKTPSLTLQTCVGSRSQYRLVVRLTKVG